MVSDAKTVLENSLLYRSFLWLRRAGKHSLIGRLIGNPKVLFAGTVIFVLGSLVRLLLSGLHVTVKFLSFILLAVILLVLVWPYTEPLTDG